MKYTSKLLVLLAPISVILMTCKPDPLAVAAGQVPTEVAISSSVIDAHTVFITATYSINSLANLSDNASGQEPWDLVSGMLVNNATVLLSSDTGTDTLQQTDAGIYGSHKLNLIPYKPYRLTVRDNTSGTVVSSSCTYFPPVSVDVLEPVIKRTRSDTTVSLHVGLQDDVSRDDYYLMSYSNINPATVPTSGGAQFSALSAGAIKKLELFTDADAVNGRITRDFTLTTGPEDPLYVHVGRIEKGYYEFLMAYKRTGSVNSQLTSEPITLPTNITTGLGYFCLYDAKRAVFFLKDY